MLARFLMSMALPALIAGLPAAAQAQAGTYPDRPVKVIVAYAPGGGADIVARIMCQRLSEKLGQQFVVVNQPGASGAMGAATAARSDPDGYTLIVGQTAEMAILPNVSGNLRYKPLEDFVPISQVTAYPYVIAVNPKVPAKTLQELIAYAKAHPKELNYGTPGYGSSAHLAVELFMRVADVQFTHVPYRGSGPAAQATASGELQLIFGDAASTTPLAEAGLVRPLAVTSDKRSPKLPNVPTVVEAGVKDYVVVAWHGFFAPKGTPPAIVGKLADTIKGILQDPELRKRFEQDAIEPVGNSPSEFTAFVKSELERWGAVAREASIKLD
ncbi:tripartite tricarboxylate transporter substrate binding protein [Aquabacter sp. CN5-332]|uniref:Bug family tripartite tricarboxylate transporter substrate binding protein n=1 Tax=Aquabacter sp. CN5-332 TaxID=3156608 RepID=UPI0032B44F20